MKLTVRKTFTPDVYRADYRGVDYRVYPVLLTSEQAEEIKQNGSAIVDIKRKDLLFLTS